MHAHSSHHIDCSLHDHIPPKSDELLVFVSDYPLEKETFRNYINDRREIFLLEVLGFL